MSKFTREARAIYMQAMPVVSNSIFHSLGLTVYTLMSTVPLKLTIHLCEQM